MSDTGTNGRVFTEGEHAALVDAAVTRETAAQAEKVTGLESRNAELQTKIDTLETEKAAAETRATTAEEALAEIERKATEKAALDEKKAARKPLAAEANPYLELTDERMERIAAMGDEAFELWLGDMREVASKVTAKTPEDGTPPVDKVEDGVTPPRATAAFGSDPAPTSKPGLRGVLAARRAAMNSNA